MWFRSLLIYRITQAIDLAAEALEVALGSKPARACESQELTTYGFAAPLGKVRARGGGGAACRPTSF